jgi:hypothetical protein
VTAHEQMGFYTCSNAVQDSMIGFREALSMYLIDLEPSSKKLCHFSPQVEEPFGLYVKPKDLFHPLVYGCL